MDWIHLDANGDGVGGGADVWDSRVVEKSDDAIGSFSVSCLFKNVADGFSWVFTGVYGPVINHHRGELWDELSAVAFRWDAPWWVWDAPAMAFNVLRFPFEKAGCNSISNEMRRFTDFINELLVDPLLGLV